MALSFSFKRPRLPRLKPAELERVGGNWLLITCALAFAAHAARLPLWLSLTSAALIVWHYLVTNHGWSRPGRIVRIALTFLLSFAVFRHYGTLFGRDAGTGFLSLLLGLKLMELRRVRDGMVAVFLCYFLVLVQFLYSQALWVAGYTALVAWSATATLMELAQPRRLDWRARARATTALLAKGLPLVVVLFLFFPRIQGSLWGLPAAGASGLTGLSEEMTPGSLSQLSYNTSVAFRVRFDGQPPPPAQRYWRALVMDVTDGNGWTPAPGITRRNSETVTPIGPAVTYTITLEPHNRDWLLALDLPAVVPDDARIAPGFLARASQPISERRQYQLTSYTDYTTAGLAAPERARNLQLPDDYSQRAMQLAATWQLRSGGDAAAIATAALQYFRNEKFFYTLSPPPLTSDDPAGQFLFETRRGYCEHYAGAFTGLMRAAGVPARVVTGYQGGELNPQGGYFIVTQADAHAWAEIWLDGRGWVRVDPTGAVAPERIEYGAEALRRMLSEGATPGQLSQSELQRIIKLDWVARALRQARLTWDLVNQGWNEWFLQFDRDRQFDLLRWLGFRTPDWVQLAGVLISGVLLFTLLFAAAVLWRRRPQDPVLRAYGTFCARLARAGVARTPGEGPLDYARRAALALPGMRTDIEHITGLYVDLRYGDATGKARQELAGHLKRFRPRG